MFAELEAAGLVRRSADRRGAVLVLTTEGTDALRRDIAHRDAWLASAFGDLSGLAVEVLGLAARIIDRLATR